MEFAILIDSTGLLNDIKIPISSLSNHNGDINNEIRVIYVTDKETGLPIFFKYIAGNIIDVSTLEYVISTVKMFNIDIKSVTLDAGYNSTDNLEYLNSLEITFVTRMQENRTEFKNIIKEYSNEIYNPIYIVEYMDKTSFCKKIEISINNNKYYAYLCLDGDRISSELKTYRAKHLSDPDNYDTKSDKFNSIAKFVLVSN
jgi:transposase